MGIVVTVAASAARDALVRMKHSVSARPSTVDRHTKRFPGEGCRALFAQRLEQSPIKREGDGHAGDEKSYRGQPID